jgi:hypothetical protein
MKNNTFLFTNLQKTYFSRRKKIQFDWNYKRLKSLIKTHRVI